MQKLRVEFSRFTVVGAINFIFTFVMFFFAVKVAEINYLIALMVVSLLGMVLTYSLNYVWVFKPEQVLKYRGRLLKYVLGGVASIAINMMALRYIVESTGIDPFFAQFLLIPFIVVFNFATAKFWSLRKNNIK